MNKEIYLTIFQQAAEELDASLLEAKQINPAVGIFLNSVCLKLYKTTWANKLPDALTAKSRIFFSVWINDAIIKEQKLYYNIHALKLRELEGYSITSRDFANDFRIRFKAFENNWPNVSTVFGPLTLMEGFVKIDLDNFKGEIISLANQFLQIEYLIDELLEERKNILPPKNT